MRVAGEDAASFLQGQFTNDLRALGDAGAVYGLWLSLKGKVVADSFVLRGGSRNEFWVGSYFSPAAVIRERLEGFIIADDVTLDDQTAEWAGWSVLGEGAIERATSLAGEGRFVFKGRRDRADNFECVYRVADQPPEGAKAGATELTAEDIARRRIAAGIPAVPADVGTGDLPNEAELEAEAISYTKGCYLGQEVMARLKSMGQVRRRLLRVRGNGAEFPPPPAAVFKASRQVGELRSAAGDGAGGWIGLAMLSRLHVAAGDRLSIAADAEPTIALIDAP